MTAHRHLRRTFSILAGLLGLAYLFPLAWVVITSLKTDGEVLHAPDSVIFTPTLSTYAAVIQSGLGAILTSVVIAVLVTAAILLIGIPGAFALGHSFGGGWIRVVAVVLGILLVLQMVPQPMTIIPLYGILARWHILGTLFGLILADIALLLPFAMMLLRPYVLAIPQVIYEAARIDGASVVRAFLSITVPMLSNGIFIVMCVIFISSWGEFLYAINFLPQGATLPVSGLLAEQNSSYVAQWNRVMALAVLTSLPLLIVFLFTQRRLINGLSMGAVR